MSDKSDFAEQLAAVPIFTGLSRRQINKLVDASKTTTHHEGHEVAKEGEGSLAMHLILSGTAEVRVHGEVQRTLGAGDYFGEISMIDGKKRSASVTASSPMSTLAVPHVAFQKLLETEPAFASTLLVLLCSRLREAESSR